jgi:hypothetical protein|tara:strand:+ start:666 stop:812 length:147 start_codon:yes stop_codon:yes gene_type:complete
MMIERVYKKDISTKKKIKNAVYNYHRENQDKAEAQAAENGQGDTSIEL